MKIVIAGAGEVGSHLAKMLRTEGNDITVIDDDDARLEKLAGYADVQTMAGSPSSIRTLKDAGVGNADLFLGVIPFATQEANLMSALLAKQLGTAKVIARINDEDFLSAENKLLFKELGIEMMVYPEKSAADEIVEYFRHSSTAETMEFARGKLQIAVFKLDEESPILDYSLGEFSRSISPEERKRFRILAVSRKSKTIIPKLETKFRHSDLVFTICKREGMPDLYRYFGKCDLHIEKVMIIGGNPIAEMLASTLDRQGVKVKLIEKDRQRCISLTDRLPGSVQVVTGDGRNSDFLYEEGINDYDAFVALTGNDETNLLSCVVAKKLGVSRTVAEVENIEYIRLAEEMGVDNVINKKLIMAERIFRFTLSGKARFIRYMTGTDAEVIEYTVAPGSAITRSPLKDVNFPQNAIIGGVIRGSEAFIAVGDTTIEPYDRVAVLALPESVRAIDHLFRQ